MIKDIINSYRTHHGIPEAIDANLIENDHCRLHCLHMLNNYTLDHTPDVFLHGKSEIVAVCNFKRNIEETEHHLIWEVINSSPGHRDILLSSKHLAHYLLIHNYKAYLTVRGWQ